MRKLKAVIAGGGIGGLATAIALLQKGIDVDVYEQAQEFREVGAGIQISPNGNRALDELGVFEALRAVSFDTHNKEFRLWNTGKTWTWFHLGDAAVAKFGFLYMTVFRPDLLRVLAERLEQLKPGALHLYTRCTGATQDEHGVRLEFENGYSVQGDLLIGADGVHSKIRAAIFGNDPTLFSGMVAWRALVPMNLLPERMLRHVTTNWIGPNGHVLQYPLQNGKVMNFVGTVEGSSWDGPPWNKPATVEECHRAFEGWHEDLHILISKAPSVHKWALCGRKFLDHWTLGRAALLGDACHPTLPFLAQGAVFTLEDAVVLARCLEAHGEDVPLALRKYEGARLERAYRMVRGATANTPRFHNPALATPEEADAFIAREWSSGAVSDRYDWLFSYDATTAPI